MTKQSYDVDENATNRSRPRDTSYKSFICALLVFLVICLIILLTTINLRGGQNQPYVESSKESEEYKDLGRNTDKSTQINEKPNQSTVSTLNKAGETTAVPTTAQPEDNINSSVPPDSHETISGSITRTSSSEPPTTTETENITENVPQRSAAFNVANSGGSTEPSTTVTENVTNNAVTPPTSILIWSKVFDSVEERGSTVPVTATENENVTITKTAVTSKSVAGFKSTVSDSVDEGGSTVPVTATEKENVMKTAVTPESVDVFRSTISDSVDEGGSTVPIAVTEEEIITKTGVTPTSNSMRTNNTKREIVVSDQVCQSRVCKEKASHILCKMNHSADACGDFYEFACGGTHQTLEESADLKDIELLLTQLESSNYVSATYVNVFKSFYDSCLHYEDYFNYFERMTKANELLLAVGKIQLDSDQISVDELTDLISKLILRQSMPLFDIGLDVDRKTSNFVLQLTLPERSTLRTGLKDWSGLSLHNEQCLKKQESELHGSHLNLKDIHKSYVQCNKNHSTYLNYVESVLLKFDTFLNLTTEQKEEQVRITKTDISFDIVDTLELSPSSEDVVNDFVKKKFDLQSIADLQRQFPVLNWERLFDTLTGHKIYGNTSVQVYFKEYFHMLFNEALPRLANNPQKFKNAFLAVYAYDLFVNTVLPRQQSNSKLFCFDQAKKLMPDVWSYLTQSMLSNSEKDYQNRTVTELFATLKGQFCKIRDDIDDDEDWMDENTRLSFLKKCNGLDLVLYKPPSEESLAEKYKQVYITGDYQSDLINLLIEYKKSVYFTQGTPVVDTTLFSYFLDPLSTKSLTLYPSNLIAVPPGLLRKVPKGLPNYFAMATIGFDLAQQLARHFDPIGINYNFTLSPNAMYSYQESAKAYSYAQKALNPRMLQHKNISFQLIGEAARNDMFVDNAAFRLVLDALSRYRSEDEVLLPWIEWTYSTKELFYVIVAQEFCEQTSVLDFMMQVFEYSHQPPLLKVENIITNSENFTATFKCPLGSGVDDSADNKLPQFPYLFKEDPVYYSGDYS